MPNLKFQLTVEKSCHYFGIKSYGKSIGDSLEALKLFLDPEMGRKSLKWGQKSRNLKVKLREEKLYHYFRAKFYSKSNGDRLKALKRCLDSKMGH